MEDFTLENKLFGEIFDWATDLKLVHKHDDVIKAKATIIGLTKHFIDKYPPSVLARTLKALIERGIVVTNMGEEDVDSLDAYFLPVNYYTAEGVTLENRLKEIEKFKQK
jgi:hypothetical protein